MPLLCRQLVENQLCLARCNSPAALGPQCGRLLALLWTIADPGTFRKLSGPGKNRARLHTEHDVLRSLTGLFGPDLHEKLEVSAEIGDLYCQPGPTHFHTSGAKLRGRQQANGGRMADADSDQKAETAPQKSAGENADAGDRVKQPAKVPKKSREDRLAEALRANLRRRKSSAKDRSTDT